jgi:GDP-L-fucose synthase
MTMQSNDKILITGGSGLVGKTLKNELIRLGYSHVMTPTSQECNLLDLKTTLRFFEDIQPDYVFHSAAAVYGIMGNMENKGISFLNNTLINTHVIEASRVINVKKIVAMGTGCVYPYPPPALPLTEDLIWKGEPHVSEDSYAHAKRAMLAQLNAYRESYGLNFAFVISGNLYGPQDKFDIHHGHVIPALVRKFYEAKKNKTPVMVWGDGSARRDFLFSEDVARALIIIMEKVDGVVNMGSNTINSIKDIVNVLAQHTTQEDQVKWDASKPNGQEYRAYDLKKLFNAGFSPNMALADGVRLTYDWYVSNVDAARK